MPKHQKASQTERYLALGAFCLLGLVGILSAQLLEEGFWRSAVEHVGTAVFIAAALGLTIDYWLKKQITEDVFSAAMGYELPDDLREEVRFVYGSRVLCEEHSQTVILSEIGNGSLRCAVGVVRTLKNIGQTEHLVDLEVALDDWRVPGHPSQILEMAYEQDGKRIEVYPGEDVDIEQRAWGPKAKFKRQIRLGPQRTITTFLKISETKPENGEHFFTFNYATSNPRVLVRHPDGFRAIVGFSHRGECMVDSYAGATKLKGLLLPNQNIRVRWWRESSVDDSSSNAESSSPSA